MIRRLTRVFLVSHLAQHVRNTYTCTLKVELLLTNDSNLVQLLAANRHFRLISVPPAPCAIVYRLVKIFKLEQAYLTTLRYTCDKWFRTFRGNWKATRHRRYARSSVVW